MLSIKIHKTENTKNAIAKDFSFAIALGQGGMWDSNPRVPDPQTGVLTKLHQYRQNIQLSRDSRNRTHNDGFGDRSYTV